MTIHDYILNLLQDGYQISKIKITNHYQYQPTISVNGQTVVVEQYTHEDQSLCEFYNSNDQLVARAKSFVSII
jgi:hypothetical protein